MRISDWSSDVCSSDLALGSGFEIRYAGGRSKLISPLPNVIELGRISDAQLIREYQACDAVVSLSRYEGFGYTALEAIACGKAFLGFHTSACLKTCREAVESLCLWPK